MDEEDVAKEAIKSAQKAKEAVESDESPQDAFLNWIEKMADHPNVKVHIIN